MDGTVWMCGQERPLLNWWMVLFHHVDRKGHWLTYGWCCFTVWTRKAIDWLTDGTVWLCGQERPLIDWWMVLFQSLDRKGDWLTDGWDCFTVIKAKATDWLTDGIVSPCGQERPLIDWQMVLFHHVVRKGHWLTDRWCCFNVWTRKAPDWLMDGAVSMSGQERPLIDWWMVLFQCLDWKGHWLTDGWCCFTLMEGKGHWLTDGWCSFTVWAGKAIDRLTDSAVAPFTYSQWKVRGNIWTLYLEQNVHILQIKPLTEKVAKYVSSSSEMYSIWDMGKTTKGDRHSPFVYVLHLYREPLHVVCWFICWYHAFMCLPVSDPWWPILRWRVCWTLLRAERTPSLQIILQLLLWITKV